jgi:hypothetical protein
MYLAFGDTIQFKLNNDKPFNDHQITGNVAIQEMWC